MHINTAGKTILYAGTAYSLLKTSTPADMEVYKLGLDAFLPLRP